MSDDTTAGSETEYEGPYGPVVTPEELTAFLRSKNRLQCECGGTLQVEESLFNKGKAFLGGIISTRRDEIVVCHVAICTSCAITTLISTEMLARIRGQNA